MYIYIYIYIYISTTYRRHKFPRTSRTCQELLDNKCFSHVTALRGSASMASRISTCCPSSWKVTAIWNSPGLSHGWHHLTSISNHFDMFQCVLLGSNKWNARDCSLAFNMNLALSWTDPPLPPTVQLPICMLPLKNVTLPPRTCNLRAADQAVRQVWHTNGNNLLQQGVLWQSIVPEQIMRNLVHPFSYR